MTEIRQELGLDASKAIQSVTALDRSLAQLEKRLTSTATATRQFNRAGKSFDQVGRRGTTAYTRLEQSAKKSSRGVRSAFDDIISVHGRYSTSLGLLGRIVFTQAAIRGLRLLQTGFRNTITTSIDFGKSLAEIQTIASGVLGSTDQLSERLRNFSSTFNLSLDDTAAATYQALSNQVVKSADDFVFMESAAELAKAGVASLEDSVNLLSGALNAFGKPVNETDKLASQFFKTVELGRLRISDLAQVFGTIAPLGRQVGVSIAELNAALATLTQRGVGVSAAGTQIRGILSGLIKPSKEMVAALKDMGFESAQAAVETLGFDGVLRALNQRVGGSAEAMAKLLPRIRGLQGGISLGGQAFDLFAQNIQKIEGAGTDLARSKAMQVMASDAEKLTSEFTKLKAELVPIGDAMVVLGTKTIQTGKAFRDVLGIGLARVIAQFTDYEVKADKVAAANENLASLFGIDSRFGETQTGALGTFTAERKSLEDILKRQQEIIGRRREAEQGQLTLEQRIAKQREQLRNEFLGKTQNADQVEEGNAKGHAERLVNIERDKLRELEKFIKDNEQLRRTSQQRIAALTQQRDTSQLRVRTADLSDPQKSLALIQRSQSLASQAQLTLEQAGRTGDQQAAQRARSMFDQAAALASEARSVAQSAGAKDRERQAGAALAQISQQQLSAEQSLSNAITKRSPQLDQQQAKQKANLATLTAAAQALKDGSSAIQAGVGPSGQIAANYERASRAAGQIAVPDAPANRAFGGGGFAKRGRINFLAAGGRGTDTIPSMLSPGEMVINAKSSRAFFSQLQSINSGQRPVFREAGGSVTNIGDVKVSVAATEPGSINARQIRAELRREILRRGGSF